MNRFENRLYTNLKSGALNPVYDNEKEDALNIFKIIDLLNEFDNENKKLKKENDELKQELFESEKEWYECHYADNPVRLDSNLEALKEEFKKRFGRDFE